MGTARWWAVSMACGAALLVVACSDRNSEPSATPEPSAPATAAAVHDPDDGTRVRYALLDLPAWRLKSAVDDEVDPDLVDRTDWWMEHERFETGSEPGSGESFSVNLTGHAEPVDDTVGRLTGFGFEFDPTTIGDTDGFVGIGPDGPTLVVWPFREGYTLMVLSYDLGVDDLLEVAGTARPATTEEWIAAGGEIRPCLPGTLGCDAEPVLD